MIEANSGRVLGILEYVTGVEEIFDLQVLPNIRRGEILAPHQRFEQPSIVTMKGGMWEVVKRLRLLHEHFLCRR
jgi:hypothetical protein